MNCAIITSFNKQQKHSTFSQIRVWMQETPLYLLHGNTVEIYWWYSAQQLYHFTQQYYLAALRAMKRYNSSEEISHGLLKTRSPPWTASTRIIKRFGLLLGTFFKVREGLRWGVMRDFSLHDAEAYPKLPEGSLNRLTHETHWDHIRGSLETDRRNLPRLWQCGSKKDGVTRRISQPKNSQLIKAFVAVQDRPRSVCVCARDVLVYRCVRSWVCC